jgi:TetR/AcrR family transcriptional regulator, cholesterol catabolism regulator
VPRTRQARSRDEKVDEILGAAERRLRDGGWDALSVAAIARELGLAQNAVYWYFPSKDHLFVAALERMLEQIATRKPRHEVGKVERILWFTDQFAALSDLRATMSERARHAPVVAAFVERLDDLLQRMLANTLRDDVPADRLQLAVETFRATAEGTFVTRLPRRERRKVLTFALEQLMRGSAG